jgi:hypothetical protein
MILFKLQQRVTNFLFKNDPLFNKTFDFFQVTLFAIASSRHGTANNY